MIENKKKKIYAILASVLVIAVILTVIIIPNEKRTVKAVDLSELSFATDDNDTALNYDAYLEQNKSLGDISNEIKISCNETVKEGQKYTVDFNASKSFASIEIAYRISSQKNSNGRFELLLNGEMPFREASAIELERQYLTEKAEEDKKGNMYTPELKEVEDILKSSLEDATGYHNAPFKFALKDGANSLSITSAIGDIYIEYIKLYKYEAPKSYKEVKKSYPANKTADDSMLIEAEYPYLRNNASVAEICDRSSAATEPVFNGYQVWNALGDSAWAETGESATWQFKVEESGLYSINFRYLQNFLSGIASSRKLMIDGEVPFSEMESVNFKFSTDWQSMTLSDEEGNAYQFYLEKGTHTITLEATLGDWTEALNTAQHIITELNDIYRRILMVTGSSPDTYRDYQIAEKLPDVITDMKTQKEALQKLTDWVYFYSGGEGEGTAILDSIIRDLKDFVEFPESIPSNLSSYSSSIASMSTWVQERSTQPLSIDCIEIVGNADKELRKTNAGFFKNFKYKFVQFIRSFSDDYGQIGDFEENSEPLEVWISSGRDQYLSLKNLIDNSYVKESGISVDLKLVSVGLVDSIIAGIAPDVSLFQGEVVNYAARGALEDFNQFSDFEEVSKRFAPQAFRPFTYDGRTYALPLTQDYSVMFVRDDIFEQIGLEVPETWDDVYNILTILQQNNMEFAFGVGYTMFLYQTQESMYKNDGKEINIDTPESIEAFTNWTSLFSEYSALLSYNFVNRFRTGDMPIGIAAFSTYNTFEVSAPEISGLWSMYPIPGIEQDDGTVKHTTVLSGSGAYIIKGTDMKNEAWDFIKWITRADIQTEYANSVENRLGASARVYSANIEAFNNLPFSAETLKILNEQRESSAGTEDMPGDYMVTRHIDNIFRKIVYQGADVRETINEYTDIINKEITKKRKEFGLEVAE